MAIAKSKKPVKRKSKNPQGTAAKPEIKAETKQPEKPEMMKPELKPETLQKAPDQPEFQKAESQSELKPSPSITNSTMETMKLDTKAAVSPQTWLDQSGPITVTDVDFEEIISKPIADDIDSAKEFEDPPQEGMLAGLKPEGEEMTGDKFQEFWGVDLWDLMSWTATAATNKDFSPLATTEEQKPMALKAAAKLEDLSYKYPRMLGWMRSPTLEAGGDFLIVGSFVKSKIDAIAKIANNQQGGAT